MKTNKIYTLLSGIALAVSMNASAQQSTEELINLLVQKQIITQSSADSLRAENAIKAQSEKEKKTKFNLFAGTPVSLSGFTQVRFLSQQAAGKPDGLAISRARLDFKGQINERWDSRLLVDFAGGPKILDAAINYKHRDWLKVSAGQFYIPFSAENTTQDRNLELVDRSQVVNALVARDKDIIGNQNGRDIGIQASGSFLKTNNRFLADYAFGGFNGAGINTTDNNESKDFSGRIIFHPLKNLNVGGSYYNGFDVWGAPAKEHVRKRNGAEFSYTYAFATIKGEYIQGLDAGVEKTGWYAQLGAFIYKKNIQLIARYDTYDPNTASDKAGDITTNYAFGINFYFNNWSKFQINYTNRVEEGTQINNDLIAAQLQLSF